MKVSVVIEGAQELQTMLETLESKLARKVIRQGVRDGQRATLDAVRANARSMVGGQMGELLARHAKIRAPRRQHRGAYTLHVQFDRDVPEFIHNSRAGKRSYIPAAIEYGHITGGTYVMPIPFGRTACGATQEEVIRRFTAKLKAGLLREATIKRYGSGGAS